MLAVGAAKGKMIVSEIEMIQKPQRDKKKKTFFKR